MSGFIFWRTPAWFAWRDARAGSVGYVRIHRYSGWNAQELGRPWVAALDSAEPTDAIADEQAAQVVRSSTGRPGMSHAKVVPLHQDTAFAEERGHDSVPWLFAKVVAQANEAVLRSEEAYHCKAKNLVEQINEQDHSIVPLDQEAHRRQTVWKAHDEQATHVPAIHSGLCRLLSLAIFGAEWVMAGTTFSGLGLDDIESYVTALGAVGAGFLLAKMIASGLRLQPHRDTEPAKKRQEAVMVGSAAIFLVLMLVGMALARVSFSMAEVAIAEQAGISDVALWGLVALQSGLYFGQMGVFYFLLPANPIAQLARVNYEHARRRLHSLLHRRANLAAQLNELTNRLRAQRDRRVEEAKQQIFDYIGALHRFGAGGLLHGQESAVRDDWFLPVASRVAKAVDAAPPDVKDLLGTAP